MTPSKHELRWRPEVVRKVMAANNIHGRADLANRLPLGRTTIYQAFDSDWSGTATHTVLAHIAGEFGVSIADLVVDPGKYQRRNTRKVLKSELVRRA